jgi:hypothetical protein
MPRTDVVPVCARELATAINNTAIHQKIFIRISFFIAENFS